MESGYAGGWVVNPTYEQVCVGTTGHAEVVHITFNPLLISFRELLEVFFATHDPTTVNRQGADVGSQYRSVIFYHTDVQKGIAEGLIDELSRGGTWNRPIVTHVEPFTAFFPAEDEHRNFFERNPGQMYCQLVIAPKVEQFRKVYSSTERNE